MAQNCYSALWLLSVIGPNKFVRCQKKIRHVHNIEIKSKYIYIFNEYMLTKNIRYFVVVACFIYYLAYKMLILTFKRFGQPKCSQYVKKKEKNIENGKKDNAMF